MEKVIRNVAEIDAADRRAIEHVIGQHLSEHQQIIICVVNLDPAHSDDAAVAASEDVPTWWRIYEGLSDSDIDRLDASIRHRADLTRTLP